MKPSTALGDRDIFTAG